MKLFFILFLIIYSHLAIGQEKPKKIVRSGITTGKGKSLYFENDKNGNPLFVLNENMNGPITMIFASKYDSANRETISYSVHSNLGYSLMEKVYGDGLITQYEYISNIEVAFPFDQKVLRQIKNRADFIQLKVFQQLKTGNRKLISIQFLEATNRVSKEIYLSDKGDTSSVNYYTYNLKNQETLFHHEVIGDKSWTWDIYYLYDERGNRVKSFRVSPDKDTSEVYNYIYDEQNNLTTENYFNHGVFQNKTDYLLNKKNQVKRELFYEGSESELDVKTNISYDKKGNVIKKVQRDYRNPKKEQKEVFKTKLKYW